MKMKTWYAIVKREGNGWKAVTRWSTDKTRVQVAMARSGDGLRARYRQMAAIESLTRPHNAADGGILILQ